MSCPRPGPLTDAAIAAIARYDVAMRMPVSTTGQANGMRIKPSAAHDGEPPCEGGVGYAAGTDSSGEGVAQDREDRVDDEAGSWGPDPTEKRD